MFKMYYEMTDVCLRAGDKESAVASLEKALDWLKNEK